VTHTHAGKNTQTRTHARTLTHICGSKAEEFKTEDSQRLKGWRGGETCKQTVNVTSSRLLSCHEPCFFAPVACLLPLAVAACYICCCCLPCKSQARGCSGLEVILGRVLSNQFLGRFGRSLEYDSASFTRGSNPIGVATKGVIE